jgi:hypothetical protein
MFIREYTSLPAPFFPPARHYDVTKSASLLTPYFSPARHYDVMHHNQCLNQTRNFHLPALFLSHMTFFILIFRTRPLSSRTPLYSHLPAQNMQFPLVPHSQCLCPCCRHSPRAPRFTLAHTTHKTHLQPHPWHPIIPSSSQLDN